MKIRFLITIIAAISVSSTFASEILNCTQAADSSITFESNGKFKAESSVKENKKYKITFVVNRKDALLKGNAANGVKLLRVNKDTFLEDTGINIIMWKLVKSPKNEKEKYLIQTKAYDSFGPVTYSTIWTCS